jgi:hypothetical protein
MSDYRPRDVVDLYIHVFPGKALPRAGASLTAACGVRPVAEPTIAGLLGVTDTARVTVSVVVPVATGPHQVRTIHDWAASIRSPWMACLGAVQPELPDTASEAANHGDLHLLPDRGR